MEVEFRMHLEACWAGIAPLEGTTTLAPPVNGICYELQAEQPRRFASIKHPYNHFFKQQESDPLLPGATLGATPLPLQILDAVPNKRLLIPLVSK